MIKVIDMGHTYELENEGGIQTLQFVRKELDGEAPKGSGVLKTMIRGTTNEEILAVMIDRMNYLQSQFPCRENALVITKLEESLMWLNMRTENRKARGVEGQNKI